MRRPAMRSVTILLATVPLLGCSPTSTDGCTEGPVVLELDPARSGFPSLADGGEVPVFIPPQGGIFTELDLSIRGVAIDDIERVHVTIDSEADERLADQLYPGFAVPLLCDGNGTAFVPRMPVRFDEGLVLESLDGVVGELALVVATARVEHERQFDVRLRVTGY